MPSATEQDFTYQTTEVVYNGAPGAPDPGRNILPSTSRRNRVPDPVAHHHRRSR
jgi:hypothetical protein